MPGISIPQFMALNYLTNHPGASLSDVAEFLGLTLSATSKLIQRLVSQEVVKRQEADDRRRICLSLTERGLSALATARIETREQLSLALQALTAKELISVSIALGALGDAFSKRWC